MTVLTYKCLAKKPHISKVTAEMTACLRCSNKVMLIKSTANTKTAK